MGSPIDLTIGPEERTARRMREIEEANGYAVRTRKAGGAGSGATGAPGANGATWYSGSGAPGGGLGANNDFYLNTATEDVYKKTAGVWSVITNIKGEKGEKGEKGAEGTAGTNGAEGPPGSAENNDWKNSVRVATTANITIATALNSGDVIDGVTLANNDRVLVKNQTTGAQNGIYVVSASPTRALDADGAGELSTASTVFVEEGLQNGRVIFQLQTTGTITIGTTAQVWLPASEWFVPTFLNSFVNYTPSPGVFSLLTYRKSRDGRVQIRGLVQHTGGTAAQVAIFQLPEGFRPLKQEIFQGQGSLNTSAYVGPIRVDVKANGEVIIVGAVASNTDYLSLSEISFYID